jgi:methanogenic corrinoid protein MtbC1
VISNHKLIIASEYYYIYENINGSYMENILEKIAHCVEVGKINSALPYPPDLKGQDGADELTKIALESGITASDILHNGFVVGMDRIGKKFSEGKAFIPQMLMSARAMSTAMIHIKPFFVSGEVKRKGVFIIGTIDGDLHDIGKNIVSMQMEGAGWEVIDLGVDVKIDKFLETAKKYQGSVIGVSALLTTTMINMESLVNAVRESSLDTKIVIGGAPVTEEFKQKIGADFYSADPNGAIEYINGLVEN